MASQKWPDRRPTWLKYRSGFVVLPLRAQLALLAVPGAPARNVLHVLWTMAHAMDASEFRKLVRVVGGEVRISLGRKRLAELAHVHEQSVQKESRHLEGYGLLERRGEPGKTMTYVLREEHLRRLVEFGERLEVAANGPVKGAFVQEAEASELESEPREGYPPEDDLPFDAYGDLLPEAWAA
jgi:hypothetical protein